MKKLLTICLPLVTALGCATEDGDWSQPVIPVTFTGIEAVNIDNSGEFPQVTGQSVKKEAYMLGVKWITAHTPNDDDDKYITGPIREGEQAFQSMSHGYSKAILCNTQFNKDIPAGKYVSKFFKETDRDYLPANINEGFVLLVAPDPGEHSFRVEYYKDRQLMFYYDTATIEFF